MRPFATFGFLILAILVPTIGKAQLLPLNVPPTITAENETWQILGEPIVSDGLVFYPTLLNVFYDPNTMTRTGVYRGIPLYQDRTIEPYSIMYLPIGGGRMRAYEQPRTGYLAGTVGSRTPSFPTTPVKTWETVLEPQLVLQGELLIVDRGVFSFGPADTIGRVAAPRELREPQEPATASALAPAATHPETIPAPNPGRNGIFIEFANAKWYSAGPVQQFSPDRFTQIGRYHDVPVYREVRGSSDRIWVPVVAGGLLTPYSRR
jgi:hypothetical protein